MVMKENEDELSLFLEMRRRENAEKEKERNLHNSDDSKLDAPPPGSKPELAPKTNLVSSLATRRTRIDEFLNSENDKNDYDWLLTPPGTPLFQSLGIESQKSVMSLIENPNARPTALKSRLSNLQVEPTDTSTKSNLPSRQPTFPSGVSSRRSSSGGSITAASRPLTPTGRPSLPAIVKSSRTSTPTSRATLTSTKHTAPSARSSTPKPTAPSSAPTARSSLPTSKSTSRSSTPTQKSYTPSNAPSISAPPGRSSSVPKAGPTISKHPVPSRGSSPTLKSRPLKPSHEAPPNLKISLPERPASASRGRPGTAISRSSSVEVVSKGQVKQSSSPSRGKVSSGSAYKNGSSAPKLSRTHSNGIDDVNPGLMGTQMVERVVNMRKLAPPKQDGSNPVGGKSCSTTDSSGFGLSLSKKSLDMAMRHMDIRPSISCSGSLRVTNIPASTMYSVRSGPTKSRTASVSDSPFATSSDASSEPSVNNNSTGCE